MKKLVGGLVVASALAVVASGSATAAKPYTLPKAPGQYCKGVPKTKITGHKKTQFAECVVHVAQLNKNNSLSASAACKGLPKKKASKTQKKTDFAFCVSAAAKAKNDLNAANSA